MTLSNLKITKGIDLFDQTTSRDLLQKANLFASSGIIGGTELQKNIFELTQDRGSYLSGNWSEVITKIKELITGQKLEVLGLQTTWLPISLYHVYCPNVENAKAKIECSDTDSLMGDTSIEILGIGGGSTFNLDFTTALGVEADNKSFAIAYEFESVWEHIKLTEPNGNSVEFCKLKEINKRYRRAHTHIIENMQLNLAEGEIDDVEEIVLERNTTGIKKLLVKAGSQLKVSSKLKLETLGLEAGTEITTVNQFDISYEYTLPGGKAYRAVHPKNASYWLWEVNSIG